MISCAAIQKLERYGQLGLKRRNVEDFVLSSLKDSKRGNVYALTHVPTWNDCLSALTKRALDDTDTPILPMSTVNESLLYAVSFATALIAHHLDTQRRPQGPHDPPRCTHSTEGMSLDGKVFATPLSEAATLLELLRRVLESAVLESGDNSQALSHLFATSMDAVLIATALRHVLAAEESEGKGDDEPYASLERLLQQLCCSATGLVVAVVRQLHIAQARQASVMVNLSAARPCPTLLQQLLAKSSKPQQQGHRHEDRPTGASVTASHVTSSRRRKSDGEGASGSGALVTDLLLVWAEATPPGTCLAALHGFTLFQKLSLVDAIVGEGPASCCAVGKERCRDTFATLLASIAGNRATRVVVYYRGDEIKLLQNNVRQTTDYALHTHVTTPPTEEATLLGLAQLPAPRQPHAALLLAQWMASIPLFYRGFCAEESWTAFAQEQRRIVLRQENDARRERRQQRQRGVPSGSRSNSVGSASGVGAGEETEKGKGNVSDQETVSSQMTALSLASRASMISTMSKASAASYQSFISLVETARANGGGGANNGTSTLGLHQSADGNTNLPLILLEEVTLALKRFMDATVTSGTSKLMDELGLRALAWRTIGELFTFVQSTMVATPLYRKGIIHNSRGEPVPVFHLGNDIRYNKGLGYEVLGILFANVVLPQLLEERSSTFAPAARKSRQVIENALTHCLAAYETIAPQVVDQNIPAILRVAAHVAIVPLHSETEGNVVHEKGGHDRTHKVKDNQLPKGKWSTNTDMTVPTTMLHAFLISLIARLGKSNQIPTLLDATITHIKSTAATQPNRLAEEDVIKTGGDDDEVEEETTAGLHAIFAHPLVRSALLEACSMALDPESILSRLLAYMTPWANAEDDTESEETLDPCATHLSQLRPREVLFLLDLTATLVEGIIPTSITASTLLERSTELELILSTFAVNVLYEKFFSNDGKDEGEKEVKNESTKDNKKQDMNKYNNTNDTNDTYQTKKKKSLCKLFAGESVRSKTQRRLMLCVLHTIYQSRELTLSSLQDLGIQNVESYLQMLEETLWQVSTRVGALVGPLSIDDLHLTLSLSTQQHYPPFVHRATLLPRLALQRLGLARSVTIVLSLPVAPTEEAKRLVAFVLCHMRSESEGGYLLPNANGEDVTRALQLANGLTEEYWQCIVQFGKRKRVRQTLVWLLRVSFASAESQNVEWLPRCLRTCAGFLLEALYDVVISVEDEEVRKACDQGTRRRSQKKKASAKRTKEEEEEELSKVHDDAEHVPLVQLCAAISNAMRQLGHIPQWPLLLQRFVHWLLCARRVDDNEERQNAKLGGRGADKKTDSEEDQEQVEPSLLEQRLVQLVMDFLSCEEGIPAVLRRALMQSCGNTRKDQEGSRKKSRMNDNEEEEKYKKDHRKKKEDQEEEEEEEEEGQQEEEKGEGEDEAEEVDIQVTKSSPHITTQRHDRKSSSHARRQQRTEANDDFINTIGVPFIPSTLLQLGYESDEDNDDTSGAHDRVVERRELSILCAHLARDIFSPEFASLLVRHCGNCKDLTARQSAAGALRRLYTAALTTFQQSNNASEKCELFLMAVVAALRRRATVSNDFTGAAVFLDTMGSAPVAFMGRQNNSLPNLTREWMELLTTLLSHVVQRTVKPTTPCTDSKTNSNICSTSDEEVFCAMSALYMSLERLSPVGAKRMREKENGHSTSHSKGGLPAKGYRHPSSGGGGVQDRYGGVKETPRKSLAALAGEAIAPVLQTLFNPPLESDCDENKNVRNTKDGNAARAASVTSLLTFLSGGAASLHVLWTLHAVHNAAMGEENRETQHPRPDHQRTSHSAPNGNDKRDNSAWLTAVLRSYDPDHSNDVHAMLDKVQRALQGETDFSPKAPSPAMHRWLSLQLHETPLLLTIFPHDVTLRRHTHRLVREATKWPSPPLLTAAAGALRRLLAAPLGGQWRGEASHILRASNPCMTTSSAAAEALRGALLELCSALPAALHEEEEMAEHVLFTVRTLLHCTSMEEGSMRRFMRLLSRTLLPRGVLWRRPHEVPQLISFLASKCLDGVARGIFSRALLNQLAAFLFQVVREAEGSTALPNAALRSLCLASATTCLFRLAAPSVDVFTTYSGDLDFLAADLLKTLQRVHLPKRRAVSVIHQQAGNNNNNEANSKRGIAWSDATMCDLCYACVGNEDSQSLLRQAAERVEEEEGNGERRIFMVQH